MSEEIAELFADLDPVDPAMWNDRERLALRPPTGMMVNEWANSFRQIDPRYGVESGQWVSKAFQVEPMNAFSDPRVREIVFMFATQLSKTEMILNCLGWSFDERPGPTLIGLPTDVDCNDFYRSRWTPFVSGTDAVKRHLTGNPSDDTKTLVQLDCCNIRIVPSGSKSRLAQYPAEIVWLDEVDKFGEWTGTDASPVDLAQERMKNYEFTSKFIMSCSPTVARGYINQAFLLTDQCEYWVPCANCGRFQILDFRHLRVPMEVRDPKVIINHDLARYECFNCKAMLDESHKELMVENGVWVPHTATVNDRGDIEGEVEFSSSRGFRLSTLYSPWVRWSRVIAKFFQVRRTPSRLMDFINGWLAQIWEEVSVKLDHEEMREHNCGNYHEGEVPKKCQILTAGVDVQKDHFWLGIRGWAKYEESFGILLKRLETWKDVLEYIQDRRYPVMGNKDGLTMKVRLACIDSAFRTSEVYQFCRERPDLFRPVRGENQKGMPWRAMAIDKHPATGEALPGSLLRWHWDKELFMDRLARYIHGRAETPTRWWLWDDPSAELLGQLVSWEKIIVRGRGGKPDKEEWRQKGDQADHCWFVECYNALAADMLGVEFIGVEDDSEASQKEEAKFDNAEFKDWTDPSAMEDWMSKLVL